ncbi:LacI family DNA-binding transcriptional regulator [Arthrobacter crystallopoietes]|uniref:Transcriptional regulator, LacI family n=1 Tax=Crystallibacter crystallopoietes TaxID=37928 RepID=A0A1H1DV95_9MICC|nr:LacI family DNA-binding transcriptional regulator [Arthrobacter crystallopoietes]AUI50173.1 LacI family transcriptional regulator [Arthrobacter crystallopoietes]SDQ79826.1 transcriptional regulator, LacI family [Arthrobacter crystallopoietes]
MRGVTIRDVAARAGVSPATASRVLSGHPATSVLSRERVEQAVAELGFRPNAQARSLRSTRTSTIGLLISDVRNPFFADLAHAAEQQALELGLITLLANANESVEQQNRYLDVLLAQRVDGLILVPQGGDNANVEMLASSGLPAVFVDRVIDDIDLPSVTADNSSGMGEAVQHLATLGHRRIGYISGPRSASTGRERFAAFQAATLDCGLERDPELVVFGDFQAGSGAAGARQLLELTNAPTALIAADGLMTMGAVRVCQELGIRIGEDLSLVGYDDIDAFAIMRPALTLIAQDADEMGRTAVRLLHEVIAGQRPEPVVLPTRLMVRKSTGPAKTGVNR